MTHGKDIAQRKQTMFDPGYTERVVNTCSGIAYTYRDYIQKTAGLTDISGPAIGDRAPDIDFERGGALFDKIRHEYFTLLTMAGDSAASVRRPRTSTTVLVSARSRIVARLRRAFKTLWTQRWPPLSHSTGWIRRLQMFCERSSSP
jgi:hypothetical protein